jgi:hypothetical protein
MEANQRVKFYADAPDGITKNKYMVYKVHDIQHALDLINRMITDGWIIRAAYYENATGLGARLSKKMIDLFAKDI